MVQTVTEGLYPRNVKDVQTFPEISENYHKLMKRYESKGRPIDDFVSTTDYCARNISQQDFKILKVLLWKRQS